MFARFAGLLLAGSLTTAVPTMALAQTQQAPLQDRWPAPSQQLETRPSNPAPAPAPAETAPVQRTQSPAPAATPGADDDDAPKTAPASATTTTTPSPSAKPAPRANKKPSAAPTAIACSGVFAHNSNHLALANAFKAQNLTFTEIEGGPDGAKLKGSVIFPNDPKRRLEVLWQDVEQRIYVHRIVITGRSTWSGPKGLRLGLTLAALEKINGKPFTLSAIDRDGAIAVTDWREGALASLPGNCSVGVRLTVDAKAPEQARAAADAEEFTSADAALRAVKPTVVEILIGYPDSPPER